MEPVGALASFVETEHGFVEEHAYFVEANPDFVEEHTCFVEAIPQILKLFCISQG